MIRKIVSVICMSVFVVLGAMQAADSCTSLRIKTGDGLVFYARTMEFGNFKSSVSVVPKGSKYRGTLPDGSSKGLAWTVKYGFVGMNVFDIPVVCDGINEKGLTMGSLYIPGYVKYQPYRPEAAAKTIAQFELNTYVLSNFATVAEVRKGISGIRVCQGPTHMGETIPLHFTLHDPSGDSLVIEYVNGELKLHDNPIGVMTNSPNFDWMLTNLSNYVNLSPDNAAGQEIAGVKILPFSQGSGLLGLPGDYTSPSRFVRMVALSQSPEPVRGAEKGLALAMTIINNVDIPEGAVRQKAAPGVTPSLDATRWSVAADLANKRYYFRNYTNKNWRMVDVAKALAGKSAIVNIEVETPPDYPDVSNTGKPLK